MTVSSSWASLSDRFWFILRGDQLACVTYASEYKGGGVFRSMQGMQCECAGWKPVIL